MFYHFKINFVLFIFCTNFILIFSNEPIQTTENAVTKGKSQITSEELLRRRKVLESYLSKSDESQENWVETYSVHFTPRAVDGMETKTIHHDVQDKNSFVDKNAMSKEVQPVEEKQLTSNESPKIDQESEVVMENEIPVNTKDLPKYDTGHSIFSETVDSKNLVKILNVDHNADQEGAPLSAKSLINIRTLFKVINIENNICLKDEMLNIVNHPLENIAKDSEKIDDNGELFHTSLTSENAETTDYVLIKDELQHQPEELERRHKILNSYKSKYGKTDDWVETYDFVLRPNENKDSKLLSSVSEKSNFDHSINSNKKLGIIAMQPPANNKMTKMSFSDCAQVRLYMNRWLKKLSNKFENVEDSVIHLSVSSESRTKLVELSSSENLDMISVDELVSNLISDFTIGRSYNWSWGEFVSSYKDIFYVFLAAIILLGVYSWRRRPLFLIMFLVIILIISFIIMNYRQLYQIKIDEHIYSLSEYLPSYKYIFYVLAAAVILFVVYYWRRSPFFLTMFFVTIMIISSIVMNYLKMYQKKIAKKHHTLSSISSSHCVNTLTANSGIYDYFSEYIRHFLYHEECEKYYESLMVEPEYEVNFFIVITDLIFNVFSSGFYVFADTLNSCVKLALRDTYFYQKIVIVIIFMFLTLMYFRYKIRLPFISLEPTIHLGSQAQDVSVPRRNFIKHTFSRIYDQEALKEINYINVNNADKVCLMEKQTDTLKDNFNVCLINTQSNPEQTSVESSKVNEMTLISEQNVKACAESIKAEIIPSEINNIDKNNTDKVGLQTNKCCDFKDDSASSCDTSIQDNHEQTCKSSSVGTSTSENYENTCSGTKT